MISDRKHYLHLHLYLCVIYVKQRAVPYSAVLRCPVLWRSIASDTASDRLNGRALLALPCLALLPVPALVSRILRLHCDKLQH
jgi:hypothetical protein